MKNIRELKIIGVDESRPPMIRKEPYIELFFQLGHQAPKEWCQDFNRLMKDANYPVKIKPEEGLIVETWVRKTDEIEKIFDSIKLAISRCTKEYIENIESLSQSSQENHTSGDVSTEQRNLNDVIAKLSY